MPKMRSGAQDHFALGEIGKHRAMFELYHPIHAELHNSLIATVHSKYNFLVIPEIVSFTYAKSFRFAPLVSTRSVCPLSPQLLDAAPDTLPDLERDRSYGRTSRKDSSSKILGLTLTAEPFEFRPLYETASSNHGRKSKRFPGFWRLVLIFRERRCDNLTYNYSIHV